MKAAWKLEEEIKFDAKLVCENITQRWKEDERY